MSNLFKSLACIPGWIILLRLQDKTATHLAHHFINHFTNISQILNRSWEWLHCSITNTALLLNQLCFIEKLNRIDTRKVQSLLALLSHGLKIVSEKVLGKMSGCICGYTRAFQRPNSKEADYPDYNHPSFKISMLGYWVHFYVFWR